jgi:hypothetical protein
MASLMPGAFQQVQQLSALGGPFSLRAAPPTPMIVTISESDKGFQSRGCGWWSTDLSSVTASPDAPFSDGTFIVGVDVAPGTWRADAAEGCYWARLRGFSGAMGDLIANDNGNGVVRIAASDRGFNSHNCGTWTRLN